VPLLGINIGKALSDNNNQMKKFSKIPFPFNDVNFTKQGLKAEIA
jgi:hypothetical protein